MTVPRDGELETALEMSAALRSGAVDSAELVERALSRARAWQGSINAFSQLWREEAMEAAQLADGQRGSSRAGALSGIPLAVKDLYDVAGHPTTGCCEAYRERVAHADAPVVSALRRAGLVFVGKTNQHELAAGGTNLVSACGRTANPWDPARITGGSSGGSGAAVAAGIVPWALGSDTGGSIRIPASMCGTLGLKPTHGRLSTVGLMPLAPSMDCPGPMAATVGDLRQLYRWMGGSRGPEGLDGTGPATGPESVRVGVPDGFFAESIHEQTLRAVATTAEALEGEGVSVRPVEGAGLTGMRSLWMDVCTAEFSAAHPSLSGERRKLVSAQPREWLIRGDRVTEIRRERAARRRQEVRDWFERLLSGVHALLVPTTPYPAFSADARWVDLGPHGRVEVERVGPGWLTCAVNLAGLPALNFPADRTPEGLPIGVSLIGRAGSEEQLLDLAEIWEATAPQPARPAQPPVLST